MLMVKYLIITLIDYAISSISSALQDALIRSHNARGNKAHHHAGNARRSLLDILIISIGK